jgi:uncharacterized protein (DUF2141 family)
MMVKDANDCILNSSTFTLVDPDNITLSANVTANTQCNASVGSVALSLSASGVTGTFTVNGVSQTGVSSAIFTNLAAGYYVATFVSDANGCTSTTNFNIININSTLAATVSFTEPLCNGGTVSATVTASGGTSPYNYTWSNGSTSQTATGLSAGSYNVIVRDTNSCAYQVAFDIDQPNRLIAEITSSTNASCNGSSTGQATVNATGGTTGYTYLWNNSQTGATATGLIAGNYTVTVTDNHSCTATATVTITQPSAVTASIPSKTDVLCKGGSTGTATASASGGSTPYSYLWNNGSADKTVVGLSAGSYTVTITDRNGCTSTSTTNISEPANALTAGISTYTNPGCEGGLTGTATVTASGGTSPYTYLWTNGETTSSISGLGAGTYQVVVTDNLGCIKEATILLTAPTGVTATITASTNVRCKGLTDGTATEIGYGGSGS